MKGKRSGGGGGSMGTITVDQLTEIVDLHEAPSTAYDAIQRLGGIRGIIQGVGSNEEDGLSEAEESSHFAARKEAYGTNSLPQKPAKPFYKFFFEALQDKTLIILMCAAVVSIILGSTLHKSDQLKIEGEDDSSGWIEGVAILIAVFLVASVSSGNDYNKDRQFRKLSEMTDNTKTVQVIRGGSTHTANVPDLVVGDIIQLETGDFIPADSLYVSGQDLQVNESAMTGEPEPVRKNDQKPILLSGCQAVTGFGKCVVIAVGGNSKWGRIKALLDTDHEDTPLQVNLERLAETIGKLGLVAAIITFIALILKWGITLAVNGDPWEWARLVDLVKFLIIAITIIVVAVPEGLPLAVTISLAYSMFKMIKDNNLVRHLAACETMGGATCICSDKTGTLTENRMTIKDMWIGGQRWTDNLPRQSDFNPLVLSLMAESMNVNSTARISVNDTTGILEYVGSQTECALLKYTKELGFDYVRSRKEALVEKLFPFSSSRTLR
eukprot:TRINITY_DN7410_c0_g5_i1.p1 TRINITY_DN7410_c0_g5~~TRINITY_DN7410_c0_g5_i1.p1  ORF type:complete len:546 (+),score=151.30 TRINITY_DN7410_c0_g5_i1:155-1639(+)